MIMNQTLRNSSQSKEDELLIRVKTGASVDKNINTT